MKRRAHGFTWVIGVLSCGWAGENFGGNIDMRGMHDPGGILRMLCRYLETGEFTDSEKKKLIPELNRQYRIYCKRNKVTPVALPQSLTKIKDSAR